MPDTALPELDFSSAKNSLSDVMTSVVHDHQPKLVRRHRGKESMLLVRPDDLARYLDTFGFDIGVTLDADEVTLEVRGFGVLGFGETFEEALDDLATELRAYSRRFFERAAFYAETERAPHAPALLRFAVTPPDEQVSLLLRDMERVAQREQQQVLAA